MNTELGSQRLTPTLEWLVTAVGNETLAYLLGCDAVDIPKYASGESRPSNVQNEIVDTLSLLRRNMPSEMDEDSINEAVQGWLMQVNQDKIIAGRLHEHACGSGASPATDDELESTLAALATDVYASFLFPPDPRIPLIAQFSNIHLTRAMFQHPAFKAFLEAVLEDPVMAAGFATKVEHSGRTGMLYTNAGTGGTLQLLLVAEQLLSRAWRRLESGHQSPAAFAQQAVDELRLARDLMAGETRPVPAKIAFTGVLMPADVQLRLDCGVVRAANESDRKLAPESLKGQLSGTGADGVSTLINYDGDVILHYEFPYEIRFAEPGTSDLSPRLIGFMQPPTKFASAVTRLRFSLMLAVDRSSRAQLVQTWQSIDAPLAPGSSLSWSDPREGAGITPTQLTEAEVAAWGEWYQRLNTTDVARIELAVGRVLRAIAERREPSDVLIDSVIAWENLFGTKEGEPTFRITTCLAILLEESFESRDELRKRLTRIYRLRSKVVHGGGNLEGDEYPLCQEALDVAIRAIRVLVSNRSDILELPDGAVRSARLLLGG